MNSEKGFLDKQIDGLNEKSVADVASIIDQMANSVSNEQVSAQIAAHERTVAEMKVYMEKAAADGLLPDESADKDAENADGSILLRSKDGAYNPIMEKISNSAASKNAGVAKNSRTLTFLHIPISGNVSRADIVNYARRCVLDSLQKGELPNCPLFTLINAVGEDHVFDEILPMIEKIERPVEGSVVYVGCDLLSVTNLEKEIFLGAEIRDADEKTASKTKNTVALAPKSTGTTSRTATAIDLKEEEIDPMPSKVRINRFSNNAANAQQYPDGVAGYSADGRVIPIDNSGASFNPTLPNVLGDMEYRNRLLGATFDGKQWFYKRPNKIKYLVVAYLGPQNCNVKTKEYFMCVFGACETKKECAEIVKHVRNQKNCYNGKIFDLAAVEIGEWFQTSPPLFAKNATATYSNPLHNEYMQAYINEQKRATVELEQRVMDEEAQAHSKKNSLRQQLIEKGMNPDLAPTPAVAQAEIAVKQQEAAQKEEMRRLAVAAEDKRLKELEQAKKIAPTAQKVTKAAAAPMSLEAKKKAIGGLEKL